MKALRLSVTTAVAAVSLIASVAGVAAADAPQLLPLEITPICADYNNSVEYWNVNNKNVDSQLISWTNIDNGHTGTYTAPNGMSYMTTYVEQADPNNTTQFVSASFNVPTQTNARHEACSDDFLASVAPAPVDPGTGGNGGGTTDPTTGNGGQGSGQVLGDSTTAAPASTATTAAAPQLAYTGASQILPYTAAAIIALFTATTAVLVRKNVL